MMELLSDWWTRYDMSMHAKRLGIGLGGMAVVGAIMWTVQNGPQWLIVTVVLLIFGYVFGLLWDMFS